MSKCHSDEMPSEFDFSGSRRADRPELKAGPVTVVVTLADGRRESRRLDLPARPDHEAVGPNSVSGIVDEVLYFVYNPDNDFVSMRLMSSFDDRVELQDEDEHGIRPLRSTSTGQVIGMTVRGYLGLFGARSSVGDAELEATIRRGLSVFATLLQAA